MGAVYVVPPQQNAVFTNQLNTIPNQPFNIFTTELPILTTTALDQLVTSPFVPVPVEAMDMFISKQAALPPASGFGAQSQSQQVINTNGIISQFPVLPSAGGNYPSATQDNTQPASNATLQRPPPSCSQPLYTGIVSENAPIGTFVVRAIATGDRIQWSISDTAFERFSVNPTTGEVSVAGSLKRRTRAAMEFKLRATDAFGLWCDAVVRINVVSDSSATPSNYPPYFTQNYYYFTIQCGTSGQRVGSVVASDTDAGQTISYQVINTNEFSVDANGNIQSTTPIQTSSQRTFVVTAVDTGFPPQTATTTVVVSVAGSCGAVNNANTPPTFSQTNYVLSASCRVNGVFVGMISARDYENNAITYTLRGTNEFNINPTTGELRAQGSLNDAAPRTFSVVATDNGVPPMSSVATVSVNVANCSPPNNPPTFSQSAFQFTVPCDTVIGTTIGSAQAYDSEANQIVYSLTGTQYVDP
ncbi:protocadherin Fat 1-like [Paramacrobiotus metropolitanus]|uniref:protocadherin Fat 1-like n=1 Tax=Paramacrobiotus metropolitanus TaxID=2943436 RepID=UPI0024459643|nr:protocadherin Fat 1-like [Paramacrobiotus metropolitanus]